MTTIRLLDARRGLNRKCEELFKDVKIAEAIYRFLCDGIEECEDAEPEIIRCKDCKYVGTDATCCLVCNREGMGLRPFHVYHDDFCSYAERRTDG